ncbi:MAG: HEPN domain-containing protein [Candidatus Thiodiazotropha sp.]
MAEAIKHFEETYIRARSQLEGSFHILEAFNEAQEEAGEPKYTYNTLTEASDMGRFGIVLAVASMDDYFTRKYAEIMVKAIKKKGVNSKFTEMLEEAGLDVAGALELLAMERPYSRIRSLAENYYSNYTTQSTDKIDKLYETIGIKNLSKHAQNRSKRKTLIASITKLVKRRHKIVHAGDLTRQGKLQKIDLPTVKRIDHVKIFVESAEAHIEHYLKQKR